ncbi:putative quinol monooxygenase [Natrialbaceae archaeon GCM10025810]|uniref:putative quinol monooxygenase n=1 Tax=Halovalidus salilacus TaxID=3075124 RepID=UPI0036213B5C
MFVVHGTVPIDPDSREEARKFFAELAEKSRAEDGIVDYRVAMDVDDPSVFRFTEQYEDEDAFETHMQTEHVQAFEERLADWVAGEIDATQFDVESSSELEF